jgi:hypothetical protein
VEFPGRAIRNGVRMVRIAGGTNGQAVRAEAQDVLSRLGKDLADTSGDLYVEVGRRVGGGSYWIYWLKEELLPS